MSELERNCPTLFWIGAMASALNLAGHRSNSVCVIHHIAMKLGRRLHWDPVTEKFVKHEYVDGKPTVSGDDEEANALLDFEHRAPYTV